VYHGTTASYKENPTTGMASAEINITDDAASDPTNVIANLNVHDKIENMESRIKDDLAVAIAQIRDEADQTPPQTTYDIADDGTVT